MLSCRMTLCAYADCRQKSRHTVHAHGLFVRRKSRYPLRSVLLEILPDIIPDGRSGVAIPAFVQQAHEQGE